MPQINQSLIIILLISYITIVTYVGYHYRKNKDDEDYFLASRQLPAWLLSITFIASWWGGGSAIDLVDQAFTQGISSFWIYGVSVLLSTFLMWVFAAGIRRVTTLSQPELMAQRYDNRCAFLLALFILIFMGISSSIQVIVIGKFFQVFLNTDYTTGAVIGTLLVLFYSLFGGFKGVVLTDLVQFIFFLFASIFLFCFTYDAAGGWQNISTSLAQHSTLGYTSFFHNIENNLAYVVTFGSSWMIQANVWQRISAARSPKDAKRMMMISFWIFIPLYLTTTLIGMFSSVIYETLPAEGIISQLLLQMEMPFVAAIIFVGLCSAIMSTMDSMFNTGALSLTVDIYKKHISPHLPEKNYVRIARWATLLMGSIALFIGIRVQSVLTISWIGADFIATGVFVPLVLGFFWKRGTSLAAYSSMLFGLIFSSYNLMIALGIDLPIAWEIASTRQAVIGMCSSLAIYITVSLLTASEHEQQKAASFIRQVGLIKIK